MISYMMSYMIMYDIIHMKSYISYEIVHHDVQINDNLYKLDFITL